MKIKVNEKNEILEYVNVGDFNDGQKYVGTLPDDFTASFKPSLWSLDKNGVIVKNPDYVEPTITQNLSPTPLQQQVAALAYQQMTSQQTITDLQTQNAQMAYQLMTQGGVTA